MNWKGQEIKTFDDFIKYGLLKCETKEEAKEFLGLYEQETESARDNVGYMIGYLPEEDWDRLFDLFDVGHPVFGRTKPSPKEALELGMKVGERVKDGETPKRAMITTRQEWEKKKEQLRNTGPKDKDFRE